MTLRPRKPLLHFSVTHVVPSYERADGVAYRRLIALAFGSPWRSAEKLLLFHAPLFKVKLSLVTMFAYPSNVLTKLRMIMIMVMVMVMVIIAVMISAVIRTHKYRRQIG